MDLSVRYAGATRIKGYWLPLLAQMAFILIIGGLMFWLMGSVPQREFRGLAEFQVFGVREHLLEARGCFCGSHRCHRAERRRLLPEVVIRELGCPMRSDVSQEPIP